MEESYLVMVPGSLELKRSTKNGKVCNSIRIRNSICPPNVRGYFEILTGQVKTTGIMSRGDLPGTFVSRNLVRTSTHSQIRYVLISIQECQ